MDAVSLVILGLAALAGIGLAAILVGVESRDGFERTGFDRADRAARSGWADRPEMPAGSNGPVFR